MAAVHSPQDVYARHLVSGRGYPLWTPEPNMSLPGTYRQEGLKIGDVGVVVPEDGSFDVFFNVSLPPTHILHEETGVPDNFTPILLSSRDITVFPEAEGAGRVISTSSVTRVRNTNTADEDSERRVEPGPLNYQFTLSSREGAVLILPEGAERCYLRNERPFLEAAIQHAVDWYTFAEQRLGRIISHDSLYLITGFHKARSWSLAAYQQGAGTGEASAHFKAVQVGRGNIPACYTWETTQAMDWRVGPSNLYYNGIPNQSMFISGFKIAIRDGILGSKWVTVKADIPSVRPYRAEFSSGPWFSNLWSGAFGSTSGSTSNTSTWTGTSSNTDSNLLVRDQPRDNVHEDDVTIHRFPQVTKPFHPSDIINQHLLHEMPSATVAVTHDSQWTTLLQNGLLKPGELSQDRLITEVASNYIPILTHEGAVYLESRTIEDDVGDDAKMAAISSEPEGDLDFPPMPQAAHLSTADDISVNSYACAYGSITNPESSHATCRTAHALQEHVTSAHADIVGTHIPVFRCGLAGCGRSWKRIEELEYHIRSSNAHHDRKVNPEDHPLFANSPESRQALPASAPARPAGLEASIPGEILAEQFRDTSSLPFNYTFEESFSRVPPTERNERKGNKMPPSCSVCKARKLKCDFVRPACGGCQRRSLLCIYDDIKGKGKKVAESISTLSLSGSASQESSHDKTGGILSCQSCQVLGLQCHVDPGKACARCTKLSVRCEYRIQDSAAFQSKGASSSEGSKVGLFPSGDAADELRRRTDFTGSLDPVPIPSNGDIGVVNNAREWVRSARKSYIANSLSTDESKQLSQPTTIVQVLVNLKWTTLRFVPMILRDKRVRLDTGFYDLEFEYDCDAPKCKIEIIKAPSRLLFQSVVDGGMGRFFKFKEGTTLVIQSGVRIQQYTNIRLRTGSGNRVASGPALTVLDVDAAGTFGKYEWMKEFENGEGVKLTIRLSPLDADGMRVTVGGQPTYLYIYRMGTPPTDDEDDTRPWVVKVVKVTRARGAECT